MIVVKLLFILSLIVAPAHAATITLIWDYNPPGQWVTHYYIAASERVITNTSLKPTDWDVFLPVGKTNKAEIYIPPFFIPQSYACWAENINGISPATIISAQDTVTRPLGLYLEYGDIDIGLTNIPQQGMILFSHDLYWWTNLMSYSLNTNYPIYPSWKIPLEEFPTNLNFQVLEIK